MVKLKSSNSHKKNKRKIIIINPETKKRIKTNIEDMGYVLKNFFVNINNTMKKRNLKSNSKRRDERNKAQVRKMWLNRQKRLFNRSDNLNILQKEEDIEKEEKNEADDVIEDKIDIIECDHEIQEKLSEIFQNIQNKGKIEEIEQEFSKRKKNLKKRMEDPHFQLTQKLYEEYKKLEHKINKIETTTDAIKDVTTCILIDINQIAHLIEIAIDDITNIEEYMKSYLGSDWQKIKHCWQKYKSGEISKAEFVKFSLKSVGVKFLRIFIRTPR